jgi:hypothetical protein
MGTIRSEMAGYKFKNFETGLHYQDYILRRPLRRTGTLALLVSIANDCQPKAFFFQVNSDIFGKTSSIIFRAKGVKTASVKHKSKRSTFNSVLEKINKQEIAGNVGFSSFFFGFLQSNFRSIGTHNLKAVLAKPDGIVSCSTANIQDFAAGNWSFGHNFDQIEIRLADIPGSVP